MRNYNCRKNYSTMLTPEIVGLLSTIHEYKGEQNLFIEAQSDMPAVLLMSDDFEHGEDSDE